MTRPSLFLIAALTLVADHWVRAAEAAETRFTLVDSSPTSWVGEGKSNYNVLPSDGWTFKASRTGNNGVSFVMRSAKRDDRPIYLDFVAPFAAQIEVGIYEDFERFPFQHISKPGMWFAMSGHGDNTASGIFEVLDAQYGATGDVQSFAVNFTHYGEEKPENWAIGELRYNYTPPIPEPATLLLAVLGIGILAIRRR